MVADVGGQFQETTTLEIDSCGDVDVQGNTAALAKETGAYMSNAALQLFKGCLFSNLSLTQGFFLQR